MATTHSLQRSSQMQQSYQITNFFPIAHASRSKHNLKGANFSLYLKCTLNCTLKGANFSVYLTCILNTAPNAKLYLSHTLRDIGNTKY
jgi:hypothetical protein